MTPFGARRLDIVVMKNGKIYGGIETKTGRSRYTASQRAKDEWIKRVGGRIGKERLEPFSSERGARAVKPKTSAQQWYDRIILSVTEAVAAEGFRKRPRALWELRRNDVAITIKFDKSRDTRSDYLRWYIDILVGSFSIEEMEPPLPEWANAKYPVVTTHWSKRLEGPPPFFVHGGWHVWEEHQVEEAANAVIATILSEGLRLIDQVDSTEKLVRYYERLAEKGDIGEVKRELIQYGRMALAKAATKGTLSDQ